MSTFLPAEKGQTIRMPSTANLMIDSADRTSGALANNFQITRTQSLMNGFFTRIATTEVVLEYNGGNITSSLNNNLITIDLSGSTTGTINQDYLAPPGFYTQAEIINWIVAQLNSLSVNVSPTPTWTVSPSVDGAWALTPSVDVYIEFSSSLSDLLGWSVGSLVRYAPAVAGVPKGFAIPGADLRPFRYLDFVSAQLTYNQDLKDNSTSVVARDVLCRWYMAWDDPPTLDQYGFPILMGYTPIATRRLFNPPKQIRWDAIQSMGNLTFQVYTDKNTLAPFNYNTNWLLTLQLSEC